jgi:hypothetical protein
MPGDWATARLMHDHVNVLPATLVTAQSANQSAHCEIRAEPLRERRRAQYRRVLTLETDHPDVEPGADLVGERGGRSLGRLGHGLACHEKSGEYSVRNSVSWYDLCRGRTLTGMWDVLDKGTRHEF